MALAQSV